MQHEQPLMISRRNFLKTSAAAGAVLSLSTLRPGPAWAATPPAAYPYRAWEDIYRKQWTWDRVVKGTHSYANCAAGCAWDIYVKDGIVWREEQTANYPRTNDQVPDFNPRGCQKGACFSQVMYSASRVKWPLKRVGERGEGKWKRVSWDEALTDIADGVLDAGVAGGTEAMMIDLGSNIDMGPQSAGKMRFFQQMGAYVADPWGELNDLNLGSLQTLGMAHLGGSSDDWFNADYLIVWCGNPVYTRIPEMHFMLEGRYNGTTLVSIAPDYNATSIHADLWVKPRIGSDIALALAMCHVVMEENLMDLPYIQEQTDLPFLVRKDTGNFLRQADMRRNGKDDVFYVWDRGRDRLRYAPGTQGHRTKSLKLRRLDPALGGRYTVETLDGPVEVEPLFVRMQEHLRQYTPEAAAAECDVHPDIIRQVARGFARAKRGLIFSSWGAQKFYHSDLMNRSRLLLCALTGNNGKRGGGLRTVGWYNLEGWALVAALPHRGLLALLKALKHVKAASASIGSSVMFDYVHAGLDQVSNEKLTELGLPREVNDYVAEAMERGWMPVMPPADKPPRVFFAGGGNYLRRVRSYPTVKEHLWPKLDLVVTVDFRMSNTGLYSDYVLPCAGYYEKISLKYAIGYIPFVHFADKAVEPLWESKSDWWIFCRLAEKIQERARARGIKGIRSGAFDRDIDFSRFHRLFTFNGHFGADDDEKVTQFILDFSFGTKGTSIKQLRRDGIARLRTAGITDAFFQISSPIPEGETVAPGLFHTEGRKQPWPTLTGRQQFLIEHPWFKELGETLPVHKGPLKAGGDYPLRLTGGHTRWSIHTMWRDNPLMLRLNRGVPYMYMSPVDAAARDIADNDYVKAFNDLSDFQIHVKVSPQVRPGQVIVYHAWEPYMFANNRNHHAVMPSPLKPTHLAGGYGHLEWRQTFGHQQPGQNDRDTVVEVVKL